MLFRNLPLCLLLLLVTAVNPSSASLLPKTLHKRTSNFRSDLRLAFRGIRNRDVVEQTPLIRTAVCVAKSSANGLTGGSGSSSNGNGNGSSGNATASGAPSGLGGNATESGSAVPVPVSSSSTITTKTTAPGPTATTTTTSKAASTPSSVASSPWNLVQNYVRCIDMSSLAVLTAISQQGTNFFNGWDFTTGVDSTTGGEPQVTPFLSNSSSDLVQAS